MDAYRSRPLESGAALHFETGMNRLGFALDEAPPSPRGVKMPDHGISLFMSHLACADTPSHPLKPARSRHSAICASCSAHPDVARQFVRHFLGPRPMRHVRPGAALFGVNPRRRPSLMEPVITLKARIVQVRDVPRGDTVGYGATGRPPGHRGSPSCRLATATLSRAADGARMGPGEQRLAEFRRQSDALHLSPAALLHMVVAFQWT